MTGNVGIT